MVSFSTKQKVASYICKIIVIISAVLGTFLSAYAGRHSFMGGRTVFMYFTIQSNIAVALVCLIGLCRMIKKSQIGKAWFVIKLVATVAITLTGVVFCFVLAPTMGARAWNIQNILTHVIVPVVSVIDFFIVGVSGSIKKSHIFYVIIPPLLYAIYAGIGYVNNWQFAEGINYPYFFLNWGSPAGAFGFSKELPLMGCGWWILVLFIFLIVIGFIYLKIVDLLKKVLKK